MDKYRTATIVVLNIGELTTDILATLNEREDFLEFKLTDTDKLTLETDVSFEVGYSATISLNEADLLTSSASLQVKFKPAKIVRPQSPSILRRPPITRVEQPRRASPPPSRAAPPQSRAAPPPRATSPPRVPTSPRAIGPISPVLLNPCVEKTKGVYANSLRTMPRFDANNCKGKTLEGTDGFYTSTVKANGAWIWVKDE